MKIYCNRKECRFFKELKEPHILQRGRIQPKGFDEYFFGTCSREMVKMVAFVLKTKVQLSRGACCISEELPDYTNFGPKCTQMDCLWNSGGRCVRDEIGIDKDGKCKSMSNCNPSGHMDWSRFPQQSGHLTDREAANDAAESKKTKSYSDHMKQTL